MKRVDERPSDCGEPRPGLVEPRAEVVGRDEVSAVIQVDDAIQGPLRADLQVIGPVAAELYVRSSREHSDCFARLCDVHPNGRSINVCDGLRRLAPGQIEHAGDGTACVRIDLWPTAHHFRAGHRVRLQVSSGAHPRFARNAGSGDPLASATRLEVSDQEVFHDPEHPSALLLPVSTAGAA